MRAGLRARRPALEKDSAMDSQPSGPPPTPMSEVGGLPGVLQDRQPAEALLRPGGAVTRWEWISNEIGLETNTRFKVSWWCLRIMR